VDEHKKIPQTLHSFSEKAGFEGSKAVG